MWCRCIVASIISFFVLLYRIRPIAHGHVLLIWLITHFTWVRTSIAICIRQEWYSNNLQVWERGFFEIWGWPFLTLRDMRFDYFILWNFEIRQFFEGVGSKILEKVFVPIARCWWRKLFVSVHYSVRMFVEKKETYVVHVSCYEEENSLCRENLLAPHTPS